MIICAKKSFKSQSIIFNNKSGGFFNLIDLYISIQNDSAYQFFNKTCPLFVDTDIESSVIKIE